MKTKGKPTLYDLYEGVPCYHVGLFAHEIEILLSMLHVFETTKSFDAVTSEVLSDKEFCAYSDAVDQLQIAFSNIRKSNTVVFPSEVK